MATGPSTTQSPYLVPTTTNVSFTSIISAGDSVPGSYIPGTSTPWRMAGAPDGIGAFDNGDGTMTVLFNHEFGSTQGTVRAHGSTGSFVDRIVIDKVSLQVLSAGDLVTSPSNVFTYNAGTQSYVAGTTAWNRFCSSDLPSQSALYDAATGLGTQNRIYLTGEEQSAFGTDGPEGRPFGFIVNGPNAGKAYELPRLGNMGFENIVLNPSTGTKTVAMMQDDQSPGTVNGIRYDGGQVYVYAGDKQATGTDIDKAGLNNGKLYGIVVPALGSGAAANETNSTNFEAGTPFTVAAIGNNGDVSAMNGAQIQADSEAKGVAEFLRPEDGAWDTLNPNRYYFVTTNSSTAPSRLWALDFVDAKDPTKGGTLRELLNGTEGQVMLDNMTVTRDGHVILQEDPGNNSRISKVWDYNPATDTLTQIGEHDPARFSGITPPFTIDEESSGVIEVTSILGSPGKQVFLLDVQAHYNFGDPTIAEGGQLLTMTVDRSVNGTSGNDTFTENGRADDAYFGREGNDTFTNGPGNDLFDGGPGIDTLIFHDRFTDVHFARGAGGSIQISGPEGTDTLIGIERLQFTNFTVDSDPNLYGRTDVGAGTNGGKLFALYDALLGRQPDPKGLSNFDDALSKGRSLASIATDFFSSAEYTARNGAASAESNKGFVDELYKVALGRAPDSAGETFWINKLDTGTSRGDVALGFALSDENLAQVSGPLAKGVYVADTEASQVARFYYGLLDRPADIAGEKNAQTALENGASLSSVAQSFLNSAEYTGANSNLSNDAYVRSLYDHALDRAPDAAGLSSWVNALNSGATRADVAVGIIQSDEAINHLAPAIEAGWHI